MSDQPDRLKRLTSMPHEMQASIIATALEERGIRATIAGQHTSGFRAEAPGWVQVLVADEDLARAQEVLDGMKREIEGIDWSQVDVGEPEEEGQ